MELRVTEAEGEMMGHGLRQTSVCRERGLGAFSAAAAILVCASCASGSARTMEPREDWLRSVGFAERRDWPSTLLHVGRAQLPGSGRISTVLSTTPEVTVGEPQGRNWGVRRRLADGTRCEMAVFLNGVQADRQTAGGNWRLDYLTWRSRLDGIEVHTGAEGPLTDLDDCGYVLIWSEDALTGEEPPFEGDIAGHVARSAITVTIEAVLEPGSRSTGVGPDGSFEFLGVPPGLYTVVLRGDDKELVRQTVQVYAYARSSIDFDVARAGPM